MISIFGRFKQWNNKNIFKDHLITDNNQNKIELRDTIHPFQQKYVISFMADVAKK